MMTNKTYNRTIDVIELRKKRCPRRHECITQKRTTIAQAHTRRARPAAATGLNDVAILAQVRFLRAYN